MAKWSLFLFLLSVSVCCGSKILVVFPVPSGSHANLGEGYLRNLLKAGHEITYITPFPPKNVRPNLRHVLVSDTVKAISASVFSLEALITKDVDLDANLIYDIMYNITRIALEDKEVQKLLHDPREHFDLVIAEWMFNDMYSGFSAVFNCPYIWSFPYEPNFVALSLIDEATNPAYTTNVAYSHVPPFTFAERVEMLWFQVVSTVKSTFYQRNLERDLYEKAYGPAVSKRGGVLPSYEDVRLNASMILGNTYVSTGTTIRLPQNFKPIGGYHIDPEVAPLPANLKKIMDNSKDGVIYFSMGSNLQSKGFPDAMKKNLLKMFGTLKQSVLWKFEESFPNLPKNVHVLEWAPQPSILAHPNCVLFITHGGLLSITEAVHFGVPIIGIPVFFDQYNNIDRAAKKGFGKKVVLSYHLANDLKVAIDEVISNPQYEQNVKEISFIYHNRPLPPGQELVHWVEHVIATKGAVHLRSPALHVPLYQKLYLDLLAVIALAIYAVKRFISFQIFTSKRNRVPKKKRT
ncbi:UDP-glucosyltransferase 2-like [Epargyreus clarus]|uniref:UDP-glucosyltransferase 2-like n=1 Tax=Epargyreus clarus TaxID=520877 RepID=UPI003C301E58